MKKLLILDTFNFLHRAYHALPSTFRDSSGEPTNAVYGVTSMVINILGLIKPDYIVAALDGEKPTFRVENFISYKAHRKPMEDNLSSQIPKVFEILEAFGIKKILVDGYEGDDVIGTLVERFSSEVEIVIVSNDRDLWQLANGNTTIMVPSNKGDVAEFMGENEISNRLGFSCKLIPDYKGLRGDPSDNIPGVFGIGEKTASSLIQSFGSLDNVYKNIDKVKPELVQKKLLENYEQAMKSRDLATIVGDVPFEVSLKDCKYDSFNKDSVKKVLEQYNFKSLIRRMGFVVDKDTNKDKLKTSVSKDQLSLF